MKQLRTRSSWPVRVDVLRMSRRTNRCTVLGPGVRAVLWVQGCPFRCKGCVAAQTLPFAGGEELGVDTLADELVALPDIEGVTFSGGEPMAQAGALARLIDRVRARRGLSFMSYTGYRLEELINRGDPDQLSLLLRLDLLVDGRYVRDRHTDLRWRGSDNQRIIRLSHRYDELVPTFEERGVWIEAETDLAGRVAWQGIPPRGFADQFERSLSDAGITLTNGGLP